MSQKLVIVRGAACSGKTTVCKKTRDFDNKIAWVSIDKVKNIFSDYEDRAMDEVNNTAVAILEYLLDKNYSVVIDGIFKNLKHYDDVVQMGKNKKIPVVAYQLECSLEILKERDRNRKGVPEGLRRAMGDVAIESLYNKVKDNPIPDAIKLNTEEKSIEECVQIIRSNFD